MSNLPRIRKAGFEVALAGDRIEIKPFKLLADYQKEFITQHKAAIMAELRAEQVSSAIIKKLVVCWTPSGCPLEVQAKNAERAAWLLRMNPEPKGIE